MLLNIFVITLCNKILLALLNATKDTLACALQASQVKVAADSKAKFTRSKDDNFDTIGFWLILYCWLYSCCFIAIVVIIILVHDD